jgi:protein LSM14
MATSYIGKPISLISHSDVRYRGILAGIDPVASTIQLSNVFSMGTESRRPPEEFIPPVQEPYQYIIFRASEVKDLAVDEPAAQPPQRQRTVHDDPAVIGASAPSVAVNGAAYSNYQSVGQQPGLAVAQGQQQGQGRGAAQNQQAAQAQAHHQNQRSQGPRSRRVNSVQNATASLETVERAIGEMRITNHTGPNTAPRPRRGAASQNREIKVPNTDFDFESSNAKFDKKKVIVPDEEGSVSSGEDDSEDKDKAYNPQRSFFDSLSSSASTAPRGGANMGRGRGGPGAGRNRREEERERNVATFGEPGGVGLMGPGRNS